MPPDGMIVPQSGGPISRFKRTLLSGAAESINFAPATQEAMFVTPMFVAGLSSKRGRKSPVRSSPPKNGAPLCE